MQNGRGFFGYGCGFVRQALDAAELTFDSAGFARCSINGVGRLQKFLPCLVQQVTEFAEFSFDDGQQLPDLTRQTNPLKAL